MSIWILAWRNIFRNRRRTALTMMAVVSGMTALIVFGGFIEFTFWALRENTIHTQIGHIQLHRTGYSTGGAAEPLKHLIENPEAVTEIVAALPHVSVVTKRLSFSGLISTGGKTLTCRGVGVIPEREEQLGSFETLTDGAPLSTAQADGAILGSELAKALGERVGAPATILTTTVDGTINAADITITGVAQSGSQDYDSVFLKLQLTTVQRLLDTQAVETIVVILDDTENTEVVANQLRGALAAKGLPIELQTWDSLAPFYDSVVSLYRALFRVMAVIIATLVLFSIANTLTMSVFERVREIGTLRAIGSRRARVIQMFLAEGLLLGLGGAAVGVMAGAATALLINALGGISMPPPPAMSRGYIALILIDPKVIATAFLLSVTVSSASAIYPAVRATRLNIVDALRHN